MGCCRGLPVERYTREETIIAYWGIGTHWGKAQSNNKKGHLIGHIKDIGYDPSKPTTRLYATKEAQPWHNDSSDMVGEVQGVSFPAIRTFFIDESSMVTSHNGRSNRQA